MRWLKPFIVVGGALAVLLSVAMLGAWLWVGSTLPLKVESAHDVESALRHSIESERQGQQAPMHRLERPGIHWQPTALSQLPPRLVASFLVAHDCPRFLQTPKVAGFNWARRIAAELRGAGPPGPGRCDYALSRALAHRLSPGDSPFATTVFAHQLHHALTKEQLVAFLLSAVWFEPGLIGLDEAARVLLQRPLEELTLAEQAELALVVPPYSRWYDVKACANQPVLRQSRDLLLENLVAAQVIGPAEAKEAQELPMRCTAVRRQP